MSYPWTEWLKLESQVRSALQNCSWFAFHSNLTELGIVPLKSVVQKECKCWEFVVQYVKKYRLN